MKRNLHAGRPSSGGLSLNVFTEAELDDIHLGSLEVLERTGVWVEADDALDIFSDGGCVVDRETRMVRIPPHLVEESIRSAPPKNYLCGRDPEQDIVLEAGRVYVSNFDEGIMIVDRAPASTGTRCSRTCTRRRDWSTPSATSTRYESAVHPGDVRKRPRASTSGRPRSQHRQAGRHRGHQRLRLPEADRDGHGGCGGEDEFRRRPLIGFGVCPVSPLKLPRDATEVIIESARAWCPDTILSMAMSGGSSPVTLAGTLVLHNAEVLSGIVLAQLVERGCPVTYGSSTTAMDLKLAAACVGSPELALFSAACAQIARRYLLPSFVAGL